MPEPDGDPADASRPILSLIIPAYNESERLPPYLEAIRAYIHRHYQQRYEVIVVDDGSSDATAARLVDLCRQWPQLRTICHETNKGKGAAVRTGILAAEGAHLLYADADGATPIDQEKRLREAIEAGADLAVGSRLLRSPEVRTRRSWRRALIGRSFSLVARCLLKLPVRDTQCGFKMLRAEPAQQLFGLSQESGYLFDLEILVLAAHCGYLVTEVPINWSDQPGSRLSIGRDGWKILRDLWRLRRRVGRQMNQLGDIAGKKDRTRP